jgi:putative ABC transport system permease protein
VLLAGAGAAAGVGVAAGAIRLLTTVVDLRLPSWMTVGLDWRVLIFLAAAATVAAVAAGLLPAIRLSHPDLVTDLKDSARGSSSGAGHQRLRHMLVVGEVAIAALLLVGAGLMLQTVWQLQRVNLGFAPDHLLTFRVELGWRAYDTLAKSADFYTKAIDGLRTRGDVVSVGVDSNLPLSGKPRDPSQIVVAGQSADEQAKNPFVNAHWVSPGLFTALEIPVLHGRVFTDDDREGTQRVVIVNQQMADRLFPGDSAIGRQLRFGTPAAGGWMTVVGIVANVRHQDVTAGPGLDMYVPYRQTNAGGMYFVVRTRADPRTVVPALSSIVWGIDPNQSFFDVRPMEDRVATILWHQRAAGWLFAAFAVLALVLAASGLYAVLSYAVSQQTREIGVRIALGASRRDVVALVLTRVMLLVGGGLAVGLVGAVAAARAVGGLLFGIGATDIRTFVAVPLLLACVAALAAYLPIRRATRVDPLVALKSEG